MLNWLKNVLSSWRKESLFCARQGGNCHRSTAWLVLHVKPFTPAFRLLRDGIVLFRKPRLLLLLLLYLATLICHCYYKSVLVSTRNIQAYIKTRSKMVAGGEVGSCNNLAIEVGQILQQVQEMLHDLRSGPMQRDFLALLNNSVEIREEARAPCDYSKLASFPRASKNSMSRTGFECNLKRV